MVAIVDTAGNPIKSSALSEPQTSKLAQLHREFAGHPSRGLSPSRLAGILQSAEQGDIRAQHELFLDMEEKDAHIFADMSKRKRALLTVAWDVIPPRNASATERKQAAYVHELLQDIPNFEDVILNALDAIGHGFAAQEIEWELIGAERVPKQITLRPQSWFQTDQLTRTELRLRDLSLDGQALQPFGWITHVHQAKSGYIARGGLHRVLAWPFLFKSYALGDLAEFLEIYGLPLRLGTYQAGASEDEKATLLRAVMSIGHDAAGVIPEGMMIDFKEAAKGSETPFMAMVDWCERSVSKAILGGTLTSQADGKTSTHALGKVHNEVRHDLMMSDAIQLAGTFTRDLVYPLLAINKGGVADRRRLPQFKFVFEDREDLSILADALPKLAGIGMRIPSDWAYERAGIPLPEEGAEVLQSTGAAAPIRARAGVYAALTQQDAPVAEGNHVAAEIDLLVSSTAPHWDALLATVKKAVDEAESLTALQQQLAARYGYLDTEELVRVMAAGLALAELKGMADVSDGQ